MALRRTALVLASGALALLAAGCVNPFQPEKAPAPTGPGVVENFSTPDKLLQTMSDAVTLKGTSGRTAYYDALSDSTSPSTPAFYAFHYPSVLDAWRLSTQRDPPSPWDIRLEKLFYDYLIERFPGFSYSFLWSRDNSSPSDELNETAGTALYHRHYDVQASSSDGLVTKYVALGYADLYFQKLNGRWYLYRWEDRLNAADGVDPADTERPTMGWRRLDSTTTGP